MSAVEVTKKRLLVWKKDIDFILVNFANPDMVGILEIMMQRLKQ